MLIRLRSSRSSGLPFGSYYVAPVTNGQFIDDDWQDPALLERLAARAVTVMLAEGRKQTIKLEPPGR